MGSLARAVRSIALALTVAGCSGRTPPAELLCEGGEPLPGGRCAAPIDVDGGPGTIADAGPVETGPFDGGPADLGQPDLGPPDLVPVQVRSETPLDFGTLLPGSRKVLALELLNPVARRKTVELVVNDPRLTVSSPRLSLGAGEERSVQVAFRAGAPAELEAAITVRSCDGACPLAVEVFGRVVQQGIRCLPLDAGAIPVETCVEARAECDSEVDQEGVFEPGPVSGSVGGRVTSEPFPIGPGARFSVRVEVCAPELGDLEGRFEGRVTFPGPAEARLSVPIEAVGVEAAPPGCELQAPTALDFGRVEVDQTEQRTLLLANRGQGECSLRAIRATGADADAFELASMVVPRIPAGGTTQVDLAFTPARSGAHAARLELESNSPSRPRIVVRLGGEGISPMPPTRFVISQRAGVAFRLSGGRPLSFSDRDDGYASELLPFPFAFLGRPVTRVFVSTNGFVTFAQPGAGSLTNRTIPAPNNPNELVAWFWDDLTFDLSTSEATVTLDGSAPSRRLTFTFRDVRRFGGGGVVNGDTRLEASVTLEEGTDAIVVHYGRARSQSAASSFDASLGWEDATGRAGGSPVTCSPTCQLSDWPTETVVRYRPSP